MCRIYGVCAIDGAKVDSIAMSSMQSRLVHGGPDQSGQVDFEDCALGSNRLAIMDPENGRQPYITEQCAVVYNGEIYNYQTLLRQYVRSRAEGGSRCDGEILPHLYSVHGIEMVRYLDGMYAFALWDRLNRRLVLARDPAGIKPLFYTVFESRLYFSSEIGALLKVNQTPRRVSPAVIDRYLACKAIYAMEVPQGWATAFDGVWALPPGSVLTFSDSEGLKLQRNPSGRHLALDRWRYSNTDVELGRQLEDGVNAALQSDVPVCSILSGGLDSSIVTSIASKMYGSPLHTFTIAYTGDWPRDERTFARAVADKCGTIHHEVLLDPAEIPTLLPLVVEHLGQPNADPITVSTFALFRAVKEGGFKVALSGDGADEIFAGYKRFKETLDSPNESLDWYVDSLAAIPSSVRASLYTKDFRNHLFNVANVGLNLPSYEKTKQLDAMLKFEVDYRLPVYHLERVDHLSAAHGVEVRVPFCGQELTALATSLPAYEKISPEGNVKHILTRVARSNNWLPECVLTRKKQPFTLPISSMLSTHHSLGEWVRDLLFDQRTTSRGYFKRSAVASIADRLTKQSDDVLALALWTLAVLELWHRRFVDSQQVDGARQ